MHLLHLTYVALLLSTTLAVALELVTNVPRMPVFGDLEAQHAVAISTDPLKLLPVDSSLPRRTRTMRDAQGRSYTCSLPDIPPSTMPSRPGQESQQAEQATAVAEQQRAAATVDGDGNQGVSLKEHAEVAGSKTPFELLEALASLCLYRQEGRWTYELCYKKHTRQFRQSDGANTAEDFSCGKYTGDDAQDESIKDDSSLSGTPTRYVSHKFTGGAKCVMTGAARQTEVRFTCMRDVADNVIVAVKEFPTCSYVFTISTPFLCKHPSFKPQPQVSQLIVCNPVDWPTSGAPSSKSGTGSSSSRTGAQAATAEASPDSTPAQQATGTCSSEVPGECLASGSRLVSELPPDSSAITGTAGRLDAVTAEHSNTAFSAWFDTGGKGQYSFGEVPVTEGNTRSHDVKDSDDSMRAAVAAELRLSGEVDESQRDPVSVGTDGHEGVTHAAGTRRTAGSTDGQTQRADTAADGEGRDGGAGYGDDRKEAEQIWDEYEMLQDAPEEAEGVNWW